MENWKTITDYEDYLISDKGKIESFITNKILNPANNGNGYNRVELFKDKISKRFYVHRLVALMFCDNIENKPQINHKNGIRNDNRAENLEWCTNKENKQHQFKYLDTIEKKEKRSENARGENHNMAKLNNNKVRTIRFLYENGLSNPEIAKIYNVSRGTINFITSNKTWIHVN